MAAVPEDLEILAVATVAVAPEVAVAAQWANPKAVAHKGRMGHMDRTVAKASNSLAAATAAHAAMAKVEATHSSMVAMMTNLHGQMPTWVRNPATASQRSADRQAVSPTQCAPAWTACRSAAAVVVAAVAAAGSATAVVVAMGAIAVAVVAGAASNYSPMQQRAQVA